MVDRYMQIIGIHSQNRTHLQRNSIAFEDFGQVDRPFGLKYLYLEAQKIFSAEIKCIILLLMDP